MNNIHDVWTDPDLADIVRGEPALAAIADALAETRAGASSHRRLRPSRLAVLAAAAAIAATIALVAPWNRASGSLTDEALAAIGSGPVLHVVVGFPSDLQLVDLSMGRTQPVLWQNEIWYDARLGVRRTTTRINGTIWADILVTPRGTYTPQGRVSGCGTASAPPAAVHVTCRPVPPGAPSPAARLNPALADFVTGYTQALADGQAKAAGSGTVDGKPVDWLVMKGPLGNEKVALDQTTHKPVLIKQGGASGQAQTVQTIETVPYDASDFALPPPGEITGGGFSSAASPSQALPLTGGAIARALAESDWAGPSLAGLPLARAELLSLHVTLDGSPPQHGIGVELDYGAVDANGNSPGPARSRTSGFSEEPRQSHSPTRSSGARSTFRQSRPHPQASSTSNSFGNRTSSATAASRSTTATTSQSRRQARASSLPPRARSPAQPEDALVNSDFGEVKVVAAPAGTATTSDGIPLGVSDVTK